MTKKINVAQGVNG